MQLALLLGVLLVSSTPAQWQRATVAASDISLPGRVPAEHYRVGGEGVGYHDTTEGNLGGELRNDDVDIQACADLESREKCHAVGVIQLGEWLAYDVHVPVAGTYAILVRYATPKNGRWLRITLDGMELIGRIDLPSTGSRTRWATVTSSPVSIGAGQHALRVTAGAGIIRLNYFKFVRTSQAGAAVLVGAGDIARCTSSSDEATVAILDSVPGTVFTLGDNAYPNGSAADFADCYEPSWGRHKARTRPALGNHEHLTPGATPYFNYFGSAAGQRGKGWYSYKVGEWHVVVLNSSCSKNGGCGPDDPQSVWLRNNLAANPSNCTLAYWHHPRWSSGEYGNDPNMQSYWDILDAAGADLVLNGHAHMYERFTPMDATGAPDATGIRQIVVGTGGGSLSGTSVMHPQSEVRNSSTFGVLKLTLSDNAYTWKFLSAAGSTFTDTGSGTCH